MESLIVVTPVFNDGSCLPPLLRDLAKVPGLPERVDVLVVDDGSVEPIHVPPSEVPDRIHSVEIARLGANVGHQRAIAIGLVEAVARDQHDAIVVIDSDGEDRPADITGLLTAHEGAPTNVVVAQRRTRTEAARFRIFYALYKTLFHVLTGQRLDFGNFSLLPATAAQRLVRMPELWNHYPATIMRSRLPITRVPIDRAHRYAGQSRMNFTALVNHGLAAIAAFIDTVFARLLVLAASITAILGVAALAGVALRLAIGVPIPGWAALGASVAVIAFVQVVAALVVVSFLTLSSRSTVSPPPQAFASGYITRIDTTS